ncbi:hypothetical protein MSP8887_01622 [Marinomonas spartinae]|uniref:DUF2889 domain-containing protein n=1 Tax=Marinomonas spartinae TaxID=1792290 RepID=UPI0008090491|nr:DUF2889 domain-containing protein [Marinomonas spartinae]SBS31968.1 hypothetical protein MSP8887_01622 [Marinomonas spartinae]
MSSNNQKTQIKQDDVNNTNIDRRIGTKANRELMHRRFVESNGYRRDDGLWDIEAHMKDLKTYDVYREFDGSKVPEGSPFHDIGLTMTLDDSFKVVDIHVYMEAFPFPNCSGAIPSFEVIKGTQIGPGWSRWLKQEFKGKVGCTHVLELLPVAATTAYQMMWGPLSDKYPEQISKTLQGLVNSCHGWSDDGPMVRKLVTEDVIRLPEEEV